MTLLYPIVLEREEDGAVSTRVARERPPGWASSEERSGERSASEG